jgi:hypothetical protein
MSLDDDIVNIINRLRPYARFWEWPNKQLKEINIVRDFLFSMNIHGLKEYHSPILGPSNNHPPDCILKNTIGEIIGVEVSELVSEVAIKDNIKGNNVYCDWTDGDILRKTRSILDTKDKKQYVGGPYHKIIILIHTDEPIINYDSCRRLLCSETYGKYVNISEAYFMLSYDPNHKCCPYVRLNIIN